MNWIKSFGLLVLFLSAHSIFAATSILSGTVSDFKGNRLDNAVVIVKGKKFSDAYTTYTNGSGEFSVEVENGQYLALYAVKGYAVDNLEFWFWNFSVERDLNLDIRIDGLEVYGMQAWNPYDGVMVYFRPMSLEKAKNWKKDPGKTEVIPIVPDLKETDIKVTIDGKMEKLRGLRKTYEKTGDGKEIESYIIHVDNNSPKARQTLCLEINSAETKERGEGCVYFNGLHGGL